MAALRREIRELDRCTKYWADDDVRKYFSPYDSPYDGYINFMNVLDNVKTRLAKV